MCLIYSTKKTRDFKRKHKTYIVAYKVLKIVRGSLKSIFYAHDWKIGINTAIAGYKYKLFNGQIVNYAIHVFLNKNYAKAYAKANEVVVPVRCYTKDLIGIGVGNEALDDIKDAAYRCVTLSRYSYNKAIKSRRTV